jgi:hypothetical protein
MASQASMAAAIDAALPIAQQDASTFFKNAQANQIFANDALKDFSTKQTNVSIDNADRQAAAENLIMQLQTQWDTSVMGDATKRWLGLLDVNSANDRAMLSEVGSINRWASDAWLQIATADWLTPEQRDQLYIEMSQTVVADLETLMMFNQTPLA